MRTPPVSGHRLGERLFLSGPCPGGASRIGERDQTAPLTAELSSRPSDGLHAARPAPTSCSSQTSNLSIRRLQGDGRNRDRAAHRRLRRSAWLPVDRDFQVKRLIDAEPHGWGCAVVYQKIDPHPPLTTSNQQRDGDGEPGLGGLQPETFVRYGNDRPIPGRGQFEGSLVAEFMAGGKRDIDQQPRVSAPQNHHLRRDGRARYVTLAPQPARIRLTGSGGSTSGRGRGATGLGRLGIHVMGVFPSDRWRLTLPHQSPAGRTRADLMTIGVAGSDRARLPSCWTSAGFRTTSTPRIRSSTSIPSTTRPKTA